MAGDRETRDPVREDGGHRPTTRASRSGRGHSWSVLVWALVLVAAVAGAGWYFAVWRGGQEPAVEEALGPDLLAEGQTTGDRAVRVVFPEWDGSGFVTEERQIPSRDRPAEDLLNIMRSLCQGPQVSGAISALPRGTRALSAFIDPADQSVVLDFSGQLVTGHPGGTLAESATLTSILRTVALNFPGTRSCVILVDGGPVETLAGHLDMLRPFDPQRWL
ncbi:MAG: GerMN domain-containing protein [Candidatus Krumholzibacteriia bacterium]